MSRLVPYIISVCVGSKNCWGGRLAGLAWPRREESMSWFSASKENKCDIVKMKGSCKCTAPLTSSFILQQIFHVLPQQTWHALPFLKCALGKLTLVNTSLPFEIYDVDFTGVKPPLNPPSTSGLTSSSYMLLNVPLAAFLPVRCHLGPEPGAPAIFPSMMLWDVVGFRFMVTSMQTCSAKVNTVASSSASCSRISPPQNTMSLCLPHVTAATRASKQLSGGHFGHPASWHKSPSSTSLFSSGTWHGVSNHKRYCRRLFFFFPSLSFCASKGENLFLDQQQWNQRIIYGTGKDKHFRLYKWNALWILHSCWLYSQLGYDFIKWMAKCSSYQIKGYVVVVLTEYNITLKFTMKHYDKSSKFHFS